MGLPSRDVLGCDQFLGNPGCWKYVSSGLDETTTKEQKELNTKTPGSIISCHLCACDQFQCLRLGGTVCVCVSALLLDGDAGMGEPVQT